MDILLCHFAKQSFEHSLQECYHEVARTRQFELGHSSLSLEVQVNKYVVYLTKRCLASYFLVNNDSE